MVAKVAGEDVVWIVCTEWRSWKKLQLSGYSFEEKKRARWDRLDISLE